MEKRHEQNALNCNAPFLNRYRSNIKYSLATGLAHLCNVANNFSNLEGNSFALGNDRLNGTSTYDMSKGSLGSFNESLSEVSDSEGSPVRVANLEVDDRVTRDRKVSAVLNIVRGNSTNISTLTLSRVLCIQSEISH